MEEQTRVDANVHLYGSSSYHCDQDGDSATIMLGTDFNVYVSSSMKGFLILAQVCIEAANRIMMKGIPRKED